MRKVRCAGVAVAKCAVKCTTLGVGLSAPYVIPALDVGCVKPCVREEYRKCFDSLASEIDRK